MSERPAIQHLFISEKHWFMGKAADLAKDLPISEKQAVQCRKDRGIVGDRYFEKAPGHKAQITFFSAEVHQSIRDEFSIPSLPPSIYRRNVVVSGIDLNSLIGVDFELGGIRFRGTEESRPCKWMDVVVAPGAKTALQGRGGLRAKILSDGWLNVGPCDFLVIEK